MKVAVTGATGFLGSCIVENLLARGYGAVALSRRPFPSASVQHLPFDLGRLCPSAEDFARLGVDGLVHCAWDFSPGNPSDYARVNRAGTQILVDAAEQGGVRKFIDISSMSAFTNCRSLYGKTKLDVEAMFLSAGGLILRPGLIWGERAAGMIGTLDSLVKNLPIVPLIGSGANALYLVHVKDLSELISCIFETPIFPERALITAAYPEQVSLRRILELRAKTYGLSRKFVPVPWRLIWLALRMFEKIAPGKGPRSDSVLGFIYSDPSPELDAPRVAGLGFTGFRRFDERDEVRSSFAREKPFSDPGLD